MRSFLTSAMFIHLATWGFDVILIALNIWAAIWLGGVLNLAIAVGVSLYMAYKIRELLEDVPTRAIVVPLKY